MVHFKWHILVSVIVGVISLVSSFPTATASRAALAFFGVLVLGIFVDLDHVSSRHWVKEARKGRAYVPEGWINRLHTFEALAGAAVFSFGIGNFFPLASFGLHMLMDGANRVNRKYSVSPLPRFVYFKIFKFFPRLTYYQWSEPENDPPRQIKKSGTK